MVETTQCPMEVALSRVVATMVIPSSPCTTVASRGTMATRHSTEAEEGAGTRDKNMQSPKTSIKKKIQAMDAALTESSLEGNYIAHLSTTGTLMLQSSNPSPLHPSLPPDLWILLVKIVK